ncbi:MAG: LysM peptidoglycan-binding domain-containing protein [Psychromonas sp.]|nr:LysM peptidoglycan-binding domain-containing protein [Psychromonas sp.]
MKFKTMITFLFAAMLPFIAFADTLTLKKNHPEKYTVKKHDTLWDISAKFLNAPWLWPHLWRANDHVNNPHLIYPGDVLTLVWIDGKPQLTRKRLKKLSPKARISNQEDPIPTIPLASITAFLSRDHIVEPSLLEDAPRLLGDALGTPRFFEGDIFYAEGKFDSKRLHGVYRVGELYKDLDTDEELGQELTFIGHAEVSVSQKVKSTDKVTPFDFLKSSRDAKQGDLILPIPEYETYPAYFIPQPVDEKITGHIIAALNNAIAIGKWDIIVINKGHRDTIKIGSMFGIFRKGAGILVSDNKIIYQSDGNSMEQIGDPDLVLPAEQIGELMVFKVYEKVSIAIVMRSSDVMSTRYIIKGLNF